MGLRIEWSTSGLEMEDSLSEVAELVSSEEEEEAGLVWKKTERCDEGGEEARGRPKGVCDEKEDEAHSEREERLPASCWFLVSLDWSNMGSCMERARRCSKLELGLAGRVGS